MRVALVHDYLVVNCGAEKCLEAFLEIFPGADIYTLFYCRNQFRNFRQYNIRTSFLDVVPFLKRRHHLFLPLYAAAAESMRLKGYDLIVSSSWGWSKAMRKDAGACHICYCHTPLRFVYHQHMRKSSLMRHNFFLRWLAEKAVKPLAAWDVATAGNVDNFISCSKNVQARVKNFYRRDSVIIPPPVDTGFFVPNGSAGRGEYYLIVSRLVPYKKIDIAIEAFNRLGFTLKIAGSGCEQGYLKGIAGRSIEFTGHITDRARLRRLYQDCRALLVPSEEDFGIVGLEAQACGKPVIAYAGGGALEYVSEAKTGIFFHEQSPEAIVKAVQRFETLCFDRELVRRNSLPYDKEIFKQRISTYIGEKCKGYAAQAKTI